MKDHTRKFIEEIIEAHTSDTCIQQHVESTVKGIGGILAGLALHCTEYTQLINDIRAELLNGYEAYFTKVNYENTDTNR